MIKQQYQLGVEQANHVWSWLKMKELFFKIQT